MKKAIIQPFIPEKHAQDVFNLYNSLLSEQWPIDEKTFTEKVVNTVVGRFVALIDETIAGFIAVNTSPENKKAQVVVLLVDKHRQRQRIGTQLLNTALEYVTKLGIEQIHLASGAGGYLWPGVPINLPDALAFFTSRGWKYDENAYDLVGNLKPFEIPSTIHQSLSDTNTTIKTIEEHEINQLLAFEKEHFPYWYHYYEMQIDNNHYHNILIALQNNTIVGTTLLFDNTQDNNNSLTWSKLLPNPVGGLGALGVAEPSRKQGIGLALAAYGTQILKERGVQTGYIGWTWLVKWYGELGYTIWREYRMGTKNSDAINHE